MPARAVDHLLERFEHRVNEAVGFRQSAAQWVRLDERGHYRPIGIRTVETIACLSLLRIFLAWEDFLEGSFLRYMCGASTNEGFAPGLTERRAIGVEHARSLVLELADQRSFLSWTHANTTRWARHYFVSGEPFVTALAASEGAMADIVSVRNRFAHRSDDAAQKFRDTVRRLLGSVPPGITPGRLLLRADDGSGLTHMEIYANALVASARAVVRPER